MVMTQDRFNNLFLSATEIVMPKDGLKNFSYGFWQSDNQFVKCGRSENLHFTRLRSDLQAEIVFITLSEMIAHDGYI